MTATYSAVATTKDQVRLELGDTDVANAILQDEEISHYLAVTGGSVLLASARGATAIAGKFARLVSTAVGGVRVEMQQQYIHYIELAAILAARATTEPGSAGGIDAVPYAGGLTHSDVQTRDADTDLVDPFFERENAPPEPIRTRDWGWS